MPLLAPVTKMVGIWHSHEFERNGTRTVKNEDWFVCAVKACPLSLWILRLSFVELTLEPSECAKESIR